MRNIFAILLILGFININAVELEECKNDNDKINGCVEKMHYKSGKLFSQTPYKNSKIDGIDRIYYENGNLMSEIPYKNGKIDGEEKIYYEDGSLLIQIAYSNDETISGECSNGKELTNALLHSIVEADISIEEVKAFCK